MNNINTKIFAALMLATAQILPFLTGQIPYFGKMLLPMHIPVLLCGFLCGWTHGIVIGFIAPLLRFFLFGMPPIIPVGIPMAFELATYGFISGYIFRKFTPSLSSIYITLIASMLSGRFVWGISSYILSNTLNFEFSFSLFLSGAFISAIPGIIFQLLIIPPLISVLRREQKRL